MQSWSKILSIQSIHWSLYWAKRIHKYRDKTIQWETIKSINHRRASRCWQIAIASCSYLQIIIKGHKIQSTKILLQHKIRWKRKWQRMPKCWAKAWQRVIDWKPLLLYLSLREVGLLSRLSHLYKKWFLKFRVSLIHFIKSLLVGNQLSIWRKESPNRTNGRGELEITVDLACFTPKTSWKIDGTFS